MGAEHNSKLMNTAQYNHLFSFIWNIEKSTEGLLNEILER